VLLDNSGRIRGVNLTAERMIGRPASQLRGRVIYEAVDDPGLCALLQYAIISMEPVVSPVRWEGGDEQELRVAARPVLDRSGRQVTGLLCVLEASPPA
jgi:PAS domain-containing protein